MPEKFSHFISDALAENVWTQDIPVLETQPDWYVFVYGDKRGKKSGFFTNNDSDAEFVGIGWTKSNVYSILNIESGKTERQIADILGTDRIIGEVWKTPVEMIADLDVDECNGYITRRLLVPITVNGHQTILAWIYVVYRKYLLEGGIRVSKHTGKTYYGSESFLEIH